MALEKEDENQVTNELRLHDSDVGSCEVQASLLTNRINSLSTHLQSAPKDVSTRRGLVSLVAKRRKLLNYLKRVKPDKYQNLIEKLGLRK